MYLFHIYTTIMVTVTIVAFGDFGRTGVTVTALEDTFLFFTSFRNVSEWKDVYSTCRPWKPGRIGALSPIRLPPRDKATKVDEKALHIYNNPPTFGYRLSYQFPRDKKCVSSGKEGTPKECFIMKSFGLLRAVVLDVNREGKTGLKYQADPAERYVSITGAGSPIERQFTEAVFLGSKDGSDNYRSTHTINGRSFPMEIYMYFEDPAFPGVHGSTQLVVLVEESEEDNDELKPVVAVIDELRKQEKAFLNKTLDIAKLELQFRNKSIAPRVHLPRRIFKSKKNKGELLAGVVLDEKEMMYFDFDPNQNPVDFFATQKVGLYDHKFNFAKSEKERERKYYEAENDFQRAKWIEKKEEFSIEEITNLYNDVLYLNADINKVATAIKDIYGKYSSFTSPKDKKCTTAAQVNKGIDDVGIQQRLLEEYNLEFGPLFRIKSADTKRVGSALVINITTTFDDYLKLCILALFDGKKAVREQAKAIKEGPADKSEMLALMGVVSRLRRYLTGAEKLKITTSNEIIELFKQFGLATEISFPYKKSPISKLFYEIFEPSLKKRRLQQKFQDFFRKNLTIFTEKNITDLKAIKRVTVNVAHRFQVSWLMPKSGGYYKYIGATPFPPCITVPETIVFEHPIKMSKSQMASLSFVPNLNSINSDHVNADWKDIYSTLPPIHPTPDDLKIEYNGKSHQFRRFDKVHDYDNSAAKKDREKARNLKALTGGSPKNIFLALPLLLSVQLFILQALV